ncbi:MAG: hypothetical protein RIT14_616 [Pseudomonadota bacterium]
MMTRLKTPCAVPRLHLSHIAADGSACLMPVLGGLAALAGSAPADVITTGGGSDLACGYAGDDSLLADAGADLLAGAEGTDVLRGGAGDDFLSAGEGSDVLVAGADPVLVGTYTPGEVDFGLDVEDGLDRLRLTGLPALLARRSLQASDA